MGVVVVIAAEVATVNAASALAGTSLSIQTRRNAQIAAGRDDAPPVATLESSRLDFLIRERSEPLVSGTAIGMIDNRRFPLPPSSTLFQPWPRFRRFASDGFTYLGGPRSARLLSVHSDR